MNEQKTILIIDDTKINIDILLDLLSDEYDILVALDGKSGLEILNEDNVDLILLDIMMPDMDGYEVCRILKNNEKTKEIPIIFLTAKTDEESIEKAYDVGGMDYITKPFKPKELFARVKTQLHIQELISDLENSKEELKFLASTDPMTGLYNRRYFYQISSHVLNLTKRENKELSIIMIDIDKFKNINDRFGHQVGDQVIISLAQMLKKQQRQSDVVCRFGGEEFLMLLPNTPLDGALVVAQKIRQDSESYKMTLDTNEILKFTISIGVSSIKVNDDKDIDASIKRADDALYNAKNSGRNKVCYVG